MTFNITERDIASTYHEGIKLYNGYNRAMELHGEGLSISDIVYVICQECGDNEEIFEKWRHKVTYWVKGNENKSSNKTHKPLLFNGINRLNKLGILPLNLNNPKFTSVNKLASWAYWKGYITIRTNRDGKNSTEGEILFNYKNEEHKKTLDNLFDQSGFEKIKLTKQRDSYYGESVLARLFYLMGIPSDRKNDNILLPTYIETIFQEKTEKSKGAIKDFLNIYLYNRINYAVDHIHLNLNHKNTLEIAEKQMNKILELFTFALPEFEIGTGIYKQNVGKVDTKGNSIEAYHARLYLYHQTRESMEEYLKKNIHSKHL